MAGFREDQRALTALTHRLSDAAFPIPALRFLADVTPHKSRSDLRSRAIPVASLKRRNLVNQSLTLGRKADGTSHRPRQAASVAMLVEMSIRRFIRAAPRRACESPVSGDLWT